MASSKGGRIAGVAFLSVLFILGFIAWAGEDIDTDGIRQRGLHWRESKVNSLGQPWRRTLEQLVSKDTADALEQDEQLRQTLDVAVDFTSRLSRDLGERYDLPVLREVGEKLARTQQPPTTKTDGTLILPNQVEQRRRDRRRRGLRRGLADLFSGVTNPAPGATTAAAPTNPLSGLTSGVTDALLSPLKSVISGIGDGLTQNIGSAALSFGIGIGAGAAQGLNMGPANTTTQVAAKVAADNGVSTTGINGAVQSLAMGGSAALVGTLSSVASSAASGGGFSLSSLLGNESVSSVAQQLADGLGSGAVKGLKLASTMRIDASGNMVMADLQPPNGSSVGAVVGAFGFGLTDSLTRNVDLSGGSGGGGLSLSPASLTGLLGDVNIGSVAQGFMRGLVQGAGDAVNLMGGVGALVNGTATLPLALPNGTIAFNDSLGGASAGFGQGLGGQGVLVSAQLVAKMYPDRMQAISAQQQQQQIRRRSSTSESIGDRSLVLRQNAVATNGSSGQTFNLSAILNAETVSTATQTVIDLLGCQGIGGVILILLGLSGSGAVPTDPTNLQLSTNVTDALHQIIPTGTISFHSSGNNYAIDGQQVLRALDGSGGNALDGISINGMKSITFIVVLVFHILIAIAVLIFILPLTLGMETVRSVLINRMRMPHAVPFPKLLPKLVSILWPFVIGPSPIILLILGAVLTGNTTHFRSAHGILGLLTVIFGIPAAVLFYIDTSRPALRATIVRRVMGGSELGWAFARALSNQLFQSLAVSTTITGFGDLGGVVLCATQAVPFEIAVAFGFGLAGLSLVGMMFAWLDFYLAWRAARSAKGKGGSKNRKLRNEKGRMRGAEEEDRDPVLAEEGGGFYERDGEGDIRGEKRFEVREMKLSSQVMATLEEEARAKAEPRRFL